MRWRLLGLLPVMSAEGVDVTRSAAGRLAGESIFVPTSLVTVRWLPSEKPDVARFEWLIGGGRETVDLRLGPDGAVQEVAMQRWGNPGNETFARHSFGVAVQDERTFSGITIPSRIIAGWWWGTDRQSEGEFFRAEITRAVFRSHAPPATDLETGRD